MTEYTPTTERVREVYLRNVWRDEVDSCFRSEPGPEFDRWLAEHDAALVEKMADEVPSTVGTGGHARSYIQRWFRARAAEIREVTK